MDFWLHYWRPADVKRFTGISGFKMDCTGSDQNRFHNEYKKGDVVWLHSIVDGEHLLLGRLILEQKMTKQDASEYVGRPFAASIRFNTYWVSEKPWLPIQSNVKINHTAKKLDFDPFKPLPPDYNGVFFQSIRKLTNADHGLLQQEWDIWME
jgi:hypothetical protein